MKYLILVGDGMADFPLEELGGRTPLEVASTSAMDEVARRGASGLFCPIPADLPPGSDIGNLSLFGYDPHETFSGRAPLEAANQGILLRPDQVAFRCNLVTLEDGRMKDFTSGHISSDEAATLIAALEADLGDSSTFFSAGVSYRHLTILSAAPEPLAAFAALSCTPPHDIIGQPYAEYLPDGPEAGRVLSLMERSRETLRNHPTNLARIAAGKLPATSIWLWGQGLTPRIASYRERFGLSGAVVSAVDLIRGIGVCAGLEVIRVPGATAYLDTNYAGKVSAALGALERADFAYLHVEAPDETSHEGRTDLKIRAIEDFDSRVVRPCLEHATSHPDCRMLVAPDHVTAIGTRTHARGAVPFAVFGAGVTPNGAAAYSESAARACGVLFPQGYELVCHVLRDAVLDVTALKPSMQ